MVYICLTAVAGASRCAKAAAELQMQGLKGFNLFRVQSKALGAGDVSSEKIV